MNWEEGSTLYDMIHSVPAVAKTVWFCSRESDSDQMDMRNLSDHKAPTNSILPIFSFLVLVLLGFEL
jgi:hypothetical protein